MIDKSRKEKNTLMLLASFCLFSFKLSIEKEEISLDT